MKNFFKEFKEFISKGNVLDMAVGIIIGGAFTAIVNSLVADILSPLISIFFGGFSLEGMAVKLQLPWVPEESWPTFNFGLFLQAIITFLITAFALFMIIKGINAMKRLARKKKDEVPADPTTRICPFCKSEIDIEATRCKFCTSELPAMEYKAEDGAAQ